LTKYGLRHRSMIPGGSFDKPTGMLTKLSFQRVPAPS